MSLQMLVAVAAGGALGAVGRYLMVSGIGHWVGHGFPYGTFAVNLIGSFALGALVEISALAWSPSEEMRAFLTVGVLGAFTTFSAFSLDAVVLWERGEFIGAGIYVVCSIALSVCGLIAGMSIFRAILT